MVKSILYVVSQLPWKIFYNDSPETSFYQKEKGNKKKMLLMWAWKKNKIIILMNTRSFYYNHQTC